MCYNKAAHSLYHNELIYLTHILPDEGKKPSEKLLRVTFSAAVVLHQGQYESAPLGQVWTIYFNKGAIEKSACMHTIMLLYKH